MTLQLPPGLPAPVIDCVAGHFPRGDETAARRAGDYWSDKAEQCRAHAEDHDALAASTPNYITGAFATAYAQGHRDLAAKFRSQADFIDTLVEELYEAAKSIEEQKWTVIGFALILSWQLARAALMFSPVGAAVEMQIDRMATQTACQVAKRRFLIFLAGQASKYATQRGTLVLAGKAMFWGALQVGGISAAVQAGQILADHRKSMDWKSVGIAAAAGGAGGGAGAVAGMWIGGRWIIPNTIAHAEKATTTAARVAYQLAGTSLTGAAGGLAGGILGALTSLALSGQQFTTKAITEGLLPAVTGGFLGAAAHGASEIRSATPPPPSGSAVTALVGDGPRPMKQALVDALADHGILTRDFDPADPAGVSQQQQLDELINLLRQSKTTAPEPAPVYNRGDWRPTGLLAAGPDNVNPVKTVEFPSRTVSAPADPAGMAHTGPAPDSSPPQPTPLRSALAAHLDTAQHSGGGEPRPASAPHSASTDTARVAGHPADSESVGARPHPADPAESPDPAPTAEAARPGRGHPADADGGGRNRMPESDHGADAPRDSETITATKHPADEPAGARRHPGEPAAQPTSDRQRGVAAATGTVPEPGTPAAGANSEPAQPIPVASAAEPVRTQEAPDAALTVLSELTPAGPHDGPVTVELSDQTTVPAMTTTVVAPEAPAPPHGDPGPRNGNGERPAARVQQPPAAQSASRDAQPTSGTTAAGTPRAEAGDRPPRVSAPKSAAAERPPVSEPVETGHGRAEDSTGQREAAGTRTADERNRNAPQAQEPEPEHGRGVDEADSANTAPESESARAHDDSDTTTTAPESGTPDPEALAQAYRVEAEAILDEYTNRDWNIVTTEDLVQMLRHGDEREAALAIIEVIHREDP
ncbi:hypothetical protein AB0M12_41450, partial [Nocardia vinacea]|uniref:WXG100-like domain-containing protein n=1 Tax=Nocardia vinacea TaxID=96468 RepID=UPI0034277049